MSVSPGQVRTALWSLRCGWSLGLTPQVEVSCENLLMTPFRWQATAVTIGAVVELVSHCLLGFDCPETEAFSYKQETQNAPSVTQLLALIFNPNPEWPSTSQNYCSVYGTFSAKHLTFYCPKDGWRKVHNLRRSGSCCFWLQASSRTTQEGLKLCCGMFCGFQSVVVIVGLWENILS